MMPRNAPEPEIDLLEYLQALYGAHDALHEVSDTATVLAAAQALRRLAPDHGLLRALDAKIWADKAVEEIWRTANPRSRNRTGISDPESGRNQVIEQRGVPPADGCGASGRST